jgi:hypothetical protein
MKNQEKAYIKLLIAFLFNYFLILVKCGRLSSVISLKVKNINNIKNPESEYIKQIELLSAGKSETTLPNVNVLYF